MLRGSDVDRARALLLILVAEHTAAPHMADHTKPRSTEAFSGLSMFQQVTALIGAVNGCTW